MHLQYTERFLESVWEYWKWQNWLLPTVQWKEIWNICTRVRPLCCWIVAIWDLHLSKFKRLNGDPVTAYCWLWKKLEKNGQKEPDVICIKFRQILVPIALTLIFVITFFVVPSLDITAAWKTLKQALVNLFHRIRLQVAAHHIFCFNCNQFEVTNERYGINLSTE